MKRFALLYTDSIKDLKQELLVLLTCSINISPHVVITTPQLPCHHYHCEIAVKVLLLQAIIMMLLYQHHCPHVVVQELSFLMTAWGNDRKEVTVAVVKTRRNLLLYCQSSHMIRKNYLIQFYMKFNFSFIHFHFIFQFIFISFIFPSFQFIHFLQ